MMRIALLLACLAAPAFAAPPPPQWQAKGRALLKHAIEVPTVAGRGRVPELAAWLGDQFGAAGWAAEDIHVVPYLSGTDDHTAALIVRWPTAGKPAGKPILLMGHLDVVEARPEDWSMDPFALIERDGYFYGRGTGDVKGPTMALMTALLRLKAEGFRPTRDLIFFATGDEESEEVGAALGAKDWRKWTDAEFGLNADAGGGSFDASGRPLGFALQSAERPLPTSR